MKTYFSRRMPSQCTPTNNTAPLSRMTTPKILAIALLLRLLAALFPHSGQATPPTHGDFEAQRHWMSLTTHLPVIEWYFHDPSWWRLDYPPLTAYHSYLCGKMGTWIKPAWFELDISRGLETTGLKIFMRSTVLLSEMVVYLPAVLVLSRLQWSKIRTSQLLISALLLQPGIILIDHAHFQYNTVMLGLFLSAICSFLSDHPLLGCGFFVAALGFKQMALFYAPAVGAYVLGSCIFPEIQIFRFVKIATATLLSFAMLYTPLLLGIRYNSSGNFTIPQDFQPFQTQILQTLHRIFPFSRGLFEDKVSNIWCTIHFSGIYKLTPTHTPPTLQLAALCLTMLLILPPCVIIFLHPRKHLILLACTTCAWAFFLASYQVHEKNILLPLIPMTALIADGKASTRVWVGFANIVGMWSLYHLLMKDNITIAYAPVLGIWLYLMDLPPFNWEVYYREDHQRDVPGNWTRIVHFSAYTGISLWHILEFVVVPPEGKAELWIVGNMICSCVGFCSCYFWCLGKLVGESGLMGQMRGFGKEWWRGWRGCAGL